MGSFIINIVQKGMIEMGLRFRKSINLGGGFRINVSKSGVGYSWGIPGYRVTKTSKGKVRKTVGIPGTGISSVEENSKNTHEKRKSYNESKQVNIDNLKDIDSADISQIQCAQYSDVISTLTKTTKYNYYTNILIWTGILIFINKIFCTTFILGILLKIFVHKFGKVKFEYFIEDDLLEIYKKKIDTWFILNTNKNLWQVIQEGKVSDKKYNAGANRVINRKAIRVTKKLPFYISTNIEPICLQLRKETLLILPDKILIVRDHAIGVVDYSSIRISSSQVNFVEDESVPSDAEIVGQTWKYVNKNGTPDKRFKDNKQLSICLYGVVYISSIGGLNIELQCSNYRRANEFEKKINSFIK